VNATLLPHGVIAVQDAYRQREALAALDGAVWAAGLKAWVVDATPGNAASLAALCPLPPEIEALLPEPEVRERPADDGRWLTSARPYAHQREAVAAAMQHFERGGRGFALLMEMGCGKTLAALEIAARLHVTADVERVLVVAPGSVVPVWTREIAAFLPGAESRELVGTRAKRVEALKQLAWCASQGAPLTVAIVNYESSWRLEDELAAWSPDLVVADESQRIKGHATKQTKGVTRIGRHAGHRLALSGTPVTNGPLDVFAQWRFLDEGVFGPSYYAFRARYAVMGGFEGKQVVGYRALDELVRRAHRIAYRVTKADALDLPETTDVTVPVVLSAHERRAYDQLARESVAEFEGGEVSVTNVLTRLLRLQQITSGVVPTDEGRPVELGSSKVDATVELVEDAVSGGGKVVVFCRFRSEIARIASRIPGALTLTGDTPQAERGELVRRFQEDDDARVLVAQIQVGGAGITLTAASTMVFCSTSFNFADFEQAKARIHRIGQSQHCTYYNLVAADTVDELIAEALARKCDVARLVVDRGAGVFRDKAETPR
jgi:SNF2 family DNA or RNA helicase